jgi:hypothetical protein
MTTQIQPQTEAQRIAICDEWQMCWAPANFNFTSQRNIWLMRDFIQTNCFGRYSIENLNSAVELMKQQLEFNEPVAPLVEEVKTETKEEKAARIKELWGKSLEEVREVVRSENRPKERKIVLPAEFTTEIVRSLPPSRIANLQTRFGSEAVNNRKKGVS